MVREAASKKQLRVQFAYDPQLTWVLADGRRLKQILVNLLANAVKFTPVGGSVGLDVGADPVADVIHLEVWDTGIGIAPEACNQLFQPFVQLDSRLSREYAGTGLGLALVKQLSELHGGSVTVVSEVGVGSRFRVTLPWCRVGAPEQVGAETGGREAAAVTLVTGATILLADDDDANSAVITDYLTAVGYQVVQAHDGREALRLAAEVQPALILMDIQMPRLEGLVAIQHLRATPAYTTTPIIALTALAMPEDRERCLAAGADDYFAKPVRLRTLRDTIAALLRTRASMT